MSIEEKLKKGSFKLRWNQDESSFFIMRWLCIVTEMCLIFHKIFPLINKF